MLAVPHLASVLAHTVKKVLLSAVNLVHSNHQASHQVDLLTSVVLPDSVVLLDSEVLN